MGAATFYVLTRGQTATQAFNEAVREAQYEYGHGGYTGTIAEKGEFVLIDTQTFYTRATVMARAEELIDSQDPRVDDKWGPAGALQVKDEASIGPEYLFFGWASE